MTPDPLLSAIAFYMLQTCAVIAAAALLERALRDGPALWRIAYWRVVLAVALAVPFLAIGSGAATDVVATEASVAVPAAGTAALPLEGLPPRSGGVELIVPGVLMAGVILRGAWLLVGVRRLFVLGRESRVWTMPEDIARLRAHLAPHADIRRHDALEQPVTFGMVRPLVLVPGGIDRLSAAEQSAVVCHELVHVARRDWMWLLAEECLRSLFWFHPAVRWAIARLQLAREQRVDELSVVLTADRNVYMRMLIDFASARPLARAAVAFMRRRDLVARLRRISQEGVMSPVRATFISAMLLMLLAVTGAGAAAALPLPSGVWQQARERLGAPGEPAGSHPSYIPASLQRAAGAAQSASGGSTPARPTVARVAPIYPAAFARDAVNAVVRVRVALTAAGGVDDVQLVSVRAWPGHASAESAAAAASLHADAANPFVVSAMRAARLWRFAAAPDQPREYTDLSFTFRAPGADADAFVAAPPPPPPPPAPATRPGGFAAGSARPGEPVPPPPPPAPPATAPQPIRVGGNVPPPHKVKDVRPVYPPDAQANGVAGVVIAEMWVGADGKVKNARVLRSIPELDQAALDSVLQWEYEPALVNGVPTDVVMVVTVNFTLTQ